MPVLPTFLLLAMAWAYEEEKVYEKDVLVLVLICQPQRLDLQQQLWAENNEER